MPPLSFWLRIIICIIFWYILKYFSNILKMGKEKNITVTEQSQYQMCVSLFKCSGLAVSSDCMELFLALIPPHRYISHTTADFTIFITWIWNLVAFVWPCLLFPCGQVVAYVTRHFPIASAFRVYSWRLPSSQLLIWDVGAMQKL